MMYNTKSQSSENEIRTLEPFNFQDLNLRKRVFPRQKKIKGQYFNAILTGPYIKLILNTLITFHKHPLFERIFIVD